MSTATVLDTITYTDRGQRHAAPVIHRAGYFAVIDVREIRGRWDRNYYRVVFAEPGPSQSLTVPQPVMEFLRSQRHARHFCDQIAAAEWFDQKGKPTEKGRAEIRQPGSLRALFFENAPTASEGGAL